MRIAVSLVCLAMLASACADSTRRERPRIDAGLRVDSGSGDGSVGTDTGPAEHCGNGRRDGDEPHTDCGGSCPPCPDGAHCNAPTDCTSGVCIMGFCLMASCSDGVQNGDEAAPDCGGSCMGCAGGMSCTAGTDCLSGVCESGTCTEAVCLDGILNGDETDVDCGGSCEGCAGGGACIVDDDCASTICDAGACTMSSCSDSVRNQDESDVDCGGTVCSPCLDGRRCVTGDDCGSLVCTGGSCIAATCMDATQNQDETDVDCGGETCGACADGEMCTVGSDCTSGVCTGGACQAPTCMDGVQNGTETDTDCGGPGACPRCADYRVCTDGTDCTAGTCTTGRCGSTGCIPFPGTSTDTFGYFGCSLPLTPATLPCPDISTTGTLATLSDDSHQSVPIGFTFDYYGTAQTMVAIQSNGALTFTNSYLTLGNACFPYASTPNDIIAVMWDDLDPGNPGSSVRYQTLGSAPNRQFVVQWDTERFSTTPMRADLRVVLYEGSNDIHVCYHNTTFGSASYDAGLNATAGIQNATSSLQFSCNTASLTNGLLLQYLHP